MPIELTVYSDFICPFCFLHAEVLRPIAAEADLAIRWVGVEIHPHTPAGGRPVAFVGSYAHKWQAFIQPFAEEHGIPIDFPQVLPNTHQAMLAAAHANAHGAGAAFHERALAAYWREKRDIADPGVLTQLLADCGLAGARPEHWQTDRCEAAVAADRAASFDDMATGFPTTMLGQFPLVGLQTPRDFRLHLARYRSVLAKQTHAS